MPELPEVETVAASLREHLVGAVVRAVETSGLPLRRKVDRAALRSALAGARIEAIDRYGKYLLVGASSGWVLLAHLGMSGRFEMAPDGAPLALHTHLRLRLDGARELRFVDPRRFGVLLPYRAEEVRRSPELRVLGPDPFGGAFDVAYLVEALRGSRRRVHDALLDQGLVAGVGNIYAAEACFLASIHPAARAGRLSAVRVAGLHRAVLAVLEQGLRNRGTTFRDYVDVNGRAGGNQRALRVYGREGEPCRRCGACVRRLVLGARSAFYCPRCQRR